MKLKIFFFFSLAFFLAPLLSGSAPLAHATGEYCDTQTPCALSTDSCGVNNICHVDSSTAAPNTSGDQSVPGAPNTGAKTTNTSSSGSTNGVTLLNPLGSGATLPSLLTSILQFVVKIGSIIVILMLVYVGFKFVAARGEPNKITEARQMLMWTIVGALILLGAQAIASGIQATVSALSTGS